MRKHPGNIGHLDEVVVKVAVAVRGTPEPVLIASDHDHRIVQMPLVGELPARSPETSRYPISKFFNPCSDRFVTHNDAPRREQVFDVPKAEHKAAVCPNCVGNERTWEPAALKMAYEYLADHRHGQRPTSILVDYLMMPGDHM